MFNDRRALLICRTDLVTGQPVIWNSWRVKWKKERQPLSRDWYKKEQGAKARAVAVVDDEKGPASRGNNSTSFSLFCPSLCKPETGGRRTRSSSSSSSSRKKALLQSSKTDSIQPIYTPVIIRVREGEEEEKEIERWGARRSRGRRRWRGGRRGTWTWASSPASSSCSSPTSSSPSRSASPPSAPPPPPTVSN